MKILFITGQSIKSNTSVTLMNLGYIKGFVELGHEVDIVCTEINENHISYDDNIFDIDNINIIEIPVGLAYSNFSKKKDEKNSYVKEYIKSILKKIYYATNIYDAQKGWINNIDFLTNNVSKKYDLIVSSSDPKHSHLFAKKLVEKKMVKFKKWIQIWGDPWAIDITRRNKLLTTKIKKEEESLIKQADIIYYVSPLTESYQKELHPKYRYKIKHLPIAYYKEYEHNNKKHKNEKIKFGYFGDYNSDIRNIRPLYNAIKTSDAELIIRGNSDLELESNIRIDVGNRVSLKILNELEQEIDIYVHLSNNSGTQIPAKAFYYCASDKPILFILDGDSEKIYNSFEKYNRFIFCNNNESSIKEAISRIYENREKLKEYEPLNDFSPKYVINKLIRDVNDYDKS